MNNSGDCLIMPINILINTNFYINISYKTIIIIVNPIKGMVGMKFPRVRKHLKLIPFKNKISVGNTPRSAIEIEDESGLILKILSLCNGAYSDSEIHKLVIKDFSTVTLQDVRDVIQQVENVGYILEDAQFDNSSLVSDKLKERHSRTINFLSNFDKEGYEQKYIYMNKILNSNVLVIGLGGVGSSITYNLAALGVNRIIGLDFDRVDLTNLNRQILYKENDIGKFKVDAAKNTVNAFNSDTEFIPLNKELRSDNEIEKIIKKYNVDFVFCAADKPPLKIYEWINQACLNTNTPWIYGGNSEVTSYFQTIIPYKSACYECKKANYESWNDSEEAISKYNSASKNGYHAQNNCIAPSSSALASFMTFEFIKIITGCAQPLSLNKLSVFDYITYSFSFEYFNRLKSCEACGSTIKGGDIYEDQDYQVK